MTALIALTQTGAENARRLQEFMPDAVLYGRTGRVEQGHAGSGWERSAQEIILPLLRSFFPFSLLS